MFLAINCRNAIKNINRHSTLTSDQCAMLASSGGRSLSRGSRTASHSASRYEERGGPTLPAMAGSGRSYKTHANRRNPPQQPLGEYARLRPRGAGAAAGGAEGGSAGVGQGFELPATADAEGVAVRAQGGRCQPVAHEPFGQVWRLFSDDGDVAHRRFAHRFSGQIFAAARFQHQRGAATPAGSTGALSASNDRAALLQRAALRACRESATAVRFSDRMENGPWNRC